MELIFIIYAQLSLKAASMLVCFRFSTALSNNGATNNFEEQFLLLASCLRRSRFRNRGNIWRAWKTSVQHLFPNTREQSRASQCGQFSQSLFTPNPLFSSRFCRLWTLSGDFLVRMPGHSSIILPECWISDLYTIDRRLDLFKTFTPLFSKLPANDYCRVDNHPRNPSRTLFSSPPRIVNAEMRVNNCKGGRSQRCK